MATEAESPSLLIDAKIAELGGWRGGALARMRGLIREADPDVVEEVKWRKPGNPSGVSVGEYAGIPCTVVAGALADPVDGAVLMFAGDDQSVAEEFDRADPYVQNGLVREWRVREWTTVVGELAATPVRRA